MKISKKVLSVTLSLAMLGSQAMPALAANPTTTGGTANILDYAVVSVVVPTTLKIALNPKGYDITTKYEKVAADATCEAGTTYYTESGGTYSKADNLTAFDGGTTYYTAVISDDQVVSLNYGIANKSTSAKTVKVDFAATYTALDGKKAIEFVDSEEKAQAYNETSNANGAKAGEYKMYLAVASADDLPTASTYVKTTDTTVDTGKTYYTKSSDVYTAVSSASNDGLGTYYEATTVIGTEISAAELSDVTMTKATAGNQAFAKGTTNKADASIAYSLGAATYALKDGETIGFETTQTELAGKLEMSALGEVAGFTLTGAVNADADWTEADANAITITPIYTIADATGTETAVENTYKQVTLETGPKASGSLSTTNKSVTISGLSDDATLTKAEIVKADDTSVVMSQGSHFTFSNGTFTIVKSDFGDSTKYKSWVLTFSDDTTVTVPIE